jgi:hypothetical protein
MKAAVPYMAALTGAPRAGAALQPPRQLFGGAARVDRTVEQPRARAAPPPEEAASASGPEPAVPAVPAGTAESQFAAIEALATGSPGALSAKLATKPATRPPTQPTGASERPAVPSHSAEPTSDTGSPPSIPHAGEPPRTAGAPPERVPLSFADPLWDEPVAFPSRAPAPAAPRAGGDRRAVSEPYALGPEPVRPAPTTASPARVASPLPALAGPRSPEAARPAGTIGPSGPLGSETPRPSAPAVPEPGRPESAAPPAPGLAPPRPVSRGGEPADQRRAPHSLPRAQPETVSIGTIEVTVVPPAKPRAVPPRPVPRRERPPSRLAASDPLRDGRRRWYGVAQG